MQRRQFLQQVLLSGASFAGGYAVAHFSRDGSLQPFLKGEEWRNAKVRNPEDLQGLRPDEEVLANAKRQIQAHRKLNFELQLLGPSGQPLAQAPLGLRQLDQGVDWGCSGAGSAYLLQTDPLHQRRSEHFARLFTCTTAKCYWNERWHQPIEQTEGLRIYDRFLDEVEWGHQLGLNVKGHPLVWTVPKAIPPWLHRHAYPQQLQILERHVKGLLEAGGDKVQRWDLVNEMLWEPAFKHIADREWPHLDPLEDLAEYIGQTLIWAREVHPDATYSLNDYGLVHTYRSEISAREQRDRYLGLIDLLRAGALLPDAVGSQSHVGGKYALDAFSQSLQHLGRAGLPLQVTEFWARDEYFPDIESEQALAEAVAQYVCNMYTVAFAHPQLHHFTYWGGGQFFTKSGTPTLLYERLFDLLHRQWKTHWQGQSDATGQVAFSGFKGSYELLLGDTPITTVTLNEPQQTIKLP